MSLQRQHFLLSYFKDAECWYGRGLNPRPPAQQTGALPTESNQAAIVSNFTRLMAREITYNNFEISVVVFMPNITTNHAITYTKKPVISYHCSRMREHMRKKMVQIPCLLTCSYACTALKDLIKTHYRHSLTDSYNYGHLDKNPV